MSSANRIDREESLWSVIARDRCGSCLTASYGALWKTGLEKAGMEQERRSLRLSVKKLKWHWPDETTLQLQFALPPGAYATSLLREIAVIANAASRE